MYRIDNATAITPIPAPAAVGPNPDHFFTAGNPGLSIPATIVDADWLNALQEEVCNVITGAGIGLSKTTRNQLVSAIQLLIAATNSTYVADTGTVNTMVVTPAPAFTGYTGGMRLSVIPKFTNTSTTPTINVNALGAKSIVRPDGSALAAGDITANGLVELIYQATLGKFVLNTIQSSRFSTSGGGYVSIPGTPIIIQWVAWSMTTSRTNNQPASAGTTWQVQSPISWPIAFPSQCFIAIAAGGIQTNSNYSFQTTSGGGTSSVDVYATVWSDVSVGQPQNGRVIGIGF